MTKYHEMKIAKPSCDIEVSFNAYIDKAILTARESGDYGKTAKTNLFKLFKLTPEARLVVFDLTIDRYHKKYL